MIKIFQGVGYSEILRGHLYWSAIPYTKGRPLDFLEDFKELDDGTNICKVVKKENGFECEIDEETQEPMSEVKVIIPHKVRIALVLQNDFLNHHSAYHQVFVVPIQTLHRAGKTKTFLDKLAIRNEYPQYHYIGEETGREAYVNIGDIKRIHKSLLLERFRPEQINVDVMTEICNKISFLLDIKEIPVCHDCKRNCANCDLKKIIVNK